ncbi:MAG: SdpI family protein [Clostridia bacterium]|nr:SdpI family protein [Clostridia bacterium]
MIKKHWMILTVTSVLTLLPIVAGLILWNQLPEQIPIHWNANGEIDGWAGKLFVVVLMPILMLGLHWLGMFVTFSDPKKQNHSGKLLQLVFWIIPILNVFLAAVTYSSAMGKGVRVEILVPVFLGLVFVVIGNYMPKCRQNYTIGIKVPWTLSSEENWNRTHRLSGWIWVIGGIFVMVSGFFGWIWVTLAAILPMALIPLVYSYILHRKGI